MRIHDVVAQLELDVLERQDQVLQQLLFGVRNDDLLANWMPAAADGSNGSSGL